MQPIPVAALLSSAAFLGYGASLVFTRAMVADFERYALSRHRVPVGLLQMAAGAGLLLGLRFPLLLALSAGGLAAMMLVAVWVRVRVGDPPASAIPAVLLLLLNAGIAVSAVRQG